MRHEKEIGKQRRRRALSVRNRLKHGLTRPRLAVFRSLKHIYAQVIDDEAGKTLAQASSLDPEVRGELPSGGNVAAAQRVGEALAKRALDAGIKQVAFDRREYKYHGRIAALADAARDGGLDLGAKRENRAQAAARAAKEASKDKGKKKKK